MTKFNTQVLGPEGLYRLQFETDNKEHYLFMQEAARTCVDGKIPRGHWIWYEVSGGRKRCKCSECGESHGSMATPCCPYCGIRLEE